MPVELVENQAPLQTKDGQEERASRRVCFVCTGNTCRSPMAEAVTNHLAAMWKNSLPAVLRESVALPWVATSAGLYPVAGDPIAQNAVLALEEAGIEGVEGADYHLHTARSLQDVSAEDMDLLVAMTPSHAMELMMRYPHMAQKITLMPTPVSDPFGGDLARYRACLAEIIDGVKRLLFESEGEA